MGRFRGEVVVFGALFLVVSLVGCWTMLPTDSVLLRLAAGIALATTCILVVFANRIIGGDDFDA